MKVSSTSKWTTLNRVLFATSLACSFPALAGSTAQGTAQFPAEQIAQFGKRVEKFAAAQGARTFIIGRIGQPKKDLPKGFNFTHAAIAVYSNITLADGQVKQGYAIHNLYQLASDNSKSELVVDYPTDFFWSVAELEAAVIVPTPELQQRLLQAIADDVPAKVHVPHYSLLANPFDAKMQNCTEHTLDVINAAIYQTTDYAQLKANAAKYFQAQRVKVGGMKLLLGNLFVKEIDTSDRKGPLQVASVTSIARYLQQNQLLSSATILTADAERPLLK